MVFPISRSLRAAPLFALLLLSLSDAARAEAPKCRYTPVASLQLRGSGDIWQPTADGSINGKPAVMLIDTGAWASMLVKDGADKFKLPLESTGTYSYGVGGASVEYVVKVDDFSLGGAHSGKAAMKVLGNMAFKPAFDAIAGADFLLQADLEISLAEKQIRFFRARDCADTYLAYWSADAAEIPFGGTDTDHLNPRFLVEVNGVKLEAMIDTGATVSVLTREAAEKAGIRLDGLVKAGSSVGFGAARVDNWVVQLDTFTLGSETIKNAQLAVHDTAPHVSGLADILLGADFLRAHRVLIAMSQRRLYVSYVGGEVFPRRVSRPTEITPAR
jgi:predicted aspartyl protease